MKILAKYGLKSWDKACRLMPYRSDKAIMKRWFNHLATSTLDSVEDLRDKYHTRIIEVTEIAAQRRKEEKQKAIAIKNEEIIAK